MKVSTDSHAPSLQKILKVMLFFGAVFDIGMYIYCKREMQRFDLPLLLFVVVPLVLLIVRARKKQKGNDVSSIPIKYYPQTQKKRKK